MYYHPDNFCCKNLEKICQKLVDKSGSAFVVYRSKLLPNILSNKVNAKLTYTLHSHILKVHIGLILKNIDFSQKNQSVPSFNLVSDFE